MNTYMGSVHYRDCQIPNENLEEADGVAGGDMFT